MVVGELFVEAWFAVGQSLDSARLVLGWIVIVECWHVGAGRKRLGVEGNGPMHQVEIDIVELQSLQRLVERCLDVERRVVLVPAVTVLLAV